MTQHLQQVPATPDLSRAPFIEALREALRPVHHEHSTAEIRSPAASGAFPADLLGPSSLVVADACRLRDDLLYACRHGQRTTLLTAANEGDLRVFCCPHVLDEMLEHAEEWAQEADVSPTDLLARWHADYLAVIRVVDGVENLGELLDLAERQRLEQLHELDPDDVPSATLAILLEAFYLSNDTRALRAVYGERLDLDAHDRWLELLRAGSDAGQLVRMGRAGLSLITGLGTSAFIGIQRLVRATGRWLPTLAAIGAAIAAARMSPEKRRRLSDAATATVQVAGDLLVAHAQLARGLKRATASPPEWTALSATLDDDRLLTRACPHGLARSEGSELSAAQLARQLPTLPVAQSATKVRAVLRDADCFAEVWRGRWQVGRPSHVSVTYQGHAS